MTPEQILLEAADVLAEDGWCQGSYHKPTGEHCALGAVMKAAGDSKILFTVAYHEALDRLHTHVGLRVPDWNDDPERTAEDVILTLKRAANHDS